MWRTTCLIASIGTQTLVEKDVISMFVDLIEGSIIVIKVEVSRAWEELESILDILHRTEN